MSHYIPRSHSPAHDGLDLVSGKVVSLIKSTDHIMPRNPSSPYGEYKWVGYEFGID